MLRSRSLLVPALILTASVARAVQGPPVIQGGRTHQGSGSYGGPPPKYNGPRHTTPASKGGGGPAAALALARIAGADAVEPLLRLLEDRSEEVRERAILALGASGSSRAVAPLLQIARDGTPVRDSKDKVSPYARPLAIVALALGRRAG